MNEVFSYIISDFTRVYGERESKWLWTILMKVIFSPFSSLSFLFWFRIAQANSYLSWFGRKACRLIGFIKNVDIPTETEIGYGLYLGHFMCIVINPKTKIGNNCNISQFLNIGSNHDTPAEIGDNVYIGPHVCIVENVKIGNNATIGAGAIVTHDIPENATAVGCPALPINFNSPGRYIRNKYCKTLNK